MTTVLGAGQRYDRIIGVGGITASTDGYLWSSESQITEPFPPRMRAQGIAVNGSSNVWVAISDNGYAATSYDLSTWSNVRLLDSDFSAQGISWSINGSGARPVFCVAGTRKYNNGNVLPGEYEDNTQIAEILINETGSIYTWDQAFTHPDDNSYFFNVKYFDDILVNGISASVWVAVGSANGQPDIWYSENINWIGGGSVPDTSTWQRVSIPAAFADRPLYDVVEYQGTLYFSGRGVIINTDDLGDPTWGTSDFFTTARSLPDYRNIAVNPAGHLVVVSSGDIRYSLDRVGWTSYDQLGYFFQSVMWFEDHWIVGTYSNLTQYTYFTSANTTTWIPRNNLVQIYGMCAY